MRYASHYRFVATARKGFACVSAAFAIFAIMVVAQEQSAFAAPQNPALDILNAPIGGSSSDKFGHSIAVNDEFAAVGAPGLPATAPDATLPFAGGVHIYQYFGNGIFNFTTSLIPANIAANDGCGTAVAASSDWVVAGAPGRNIFTTSNQLQAGIVWAWKRTVGTTWDPIPFSLAHPDPKSIDLFGSSVALQDDTVAGVTHRTIVVGAPGDNVVYPDCGSVSVFDWNGSRWVPTAFIAPPTLTGEDGSLVAYGFFGSAVAIAGDFMVIGAKRQTATVNKQGTAFVFRRNTLANPAPFILQTNSSWGEWCLVQRIVAQVPTADAQFGAAVTLTQFNLMIGAPGGANSPGSASLYRIDSVGGTFVHDQQIVAYAGQNGDQFGTAMVMRGETAYVGAPGVNAGAGSAEISNRGAVYLFERSDGCGSWTQGVSLLPSMDPSAATIPDAAFGTAVDFTAQCVAVSAPKGNNAQLGQGVVLTYALIANSCVWDLTGDGGVSGADLTLFFSHWGGSLPSDQIADYNHDGIVNGLDLSYILAHWGSCDCVP